jgi:hypothetical protein
MFYWLATRQDPAWARQRFIDSAKVPELNGDAEEPTDPTRARDWPKENHDQKILDVLSEPGLEAGLTFERLLIASGLPQTTFRRELKTLADRGAIDKTVDRYHIPNSGPLYL